MEFLSSDEESSELEFWNNWLPPSLCKSDIDSNRVRKNLKRKIKFSTSLRTSVNSLIESSDVGSWIPPMSFLNRKKVTNVKSIQSGKEKDLSDIKIKKGSSGTRFISEKSSEYINIAAVWKQKMNSDWGKRVELHNVVCFNDGDSVWGILNLGYFANIKLWVNEYGNICGSAEGKVSKLNSSEITFIYITNTQLLRKILSLSNSQWTSLCEMVQETKITLEFDAFQDNEIAKKTYLEKLWFFICKRRHLLSNQCMWVKLCGAVKCMRNFQIMPKLLVQDIRGVLKD